jgi:hypothetical protein
MKKKLFTVLLICVMVLTFVGCGTTYQEAAATSNEKDYANGYFTVLTEWSDAFAQYRIVYANDTKVKYFVTNDSQYNSGITPLYNADGTLQIYDGN